MDYNRARKQKILIIDDSTLNRSILTDMLGDEFEIIEAEDGVQGVSILHKRVSELSLVLLDIVMPRMDGFGVLSAMQQNHWTEAVPVVMLSTESDTPFVKRAYEMGVTDFIVRPFDTLIVRRRVSNAIFLHEKQKKLVELVSEQLHEKEDHSGLMIDVLSHIVEFRSGDSELHVLHVDTLTELLLERLAEKTDRYHLSQADISLISTASSLHDIGKIAIDEKILNKPGKLTAGEFEIMKTHSRIGADMLKEFPAHRDKPLLKTAYEICRWHHERCDGGGYPDGLTGDEIPISAQVVAVADVYTALTSKRVYKHAYSHETAVRMIQEGQCGVFNPLLLECLNDISDSLAEKPEQDMQAQLDRHESWRLTQEALGGKKAIASERSLRLLDHERMKYHFFADMSEEIQFEYTLTPPAVTLSSWGAKKLKLDECIVDPARDQRVLSIVGADGWKRIAKSLRGTSPQEPVIHCECVLHCNGWARWHRIIARAIWSGDNPSQYTGCIGKAVDIHESRMRLMELEQQASHDSLTGLLNRAYAKKQISERMAQYPEDGFSLVICDLDKFKNANDTYGHAFGDCVLKHLSEKLRHNTRGNDIVARIGGDEFMLFLQYGSNIEAVIDRIFSSLLGNYEQFPISVSMGVAQTEVVGRDYETLFRAADQALYTAKRAGRGRYCFYKESMEDTASSISPIDGQSAGQGTQLRRG